MFECFVATRWITKWVDFMNVYKLYELISFYILEHWKWESVDLNGRQTSVIALYTLQSPYKIPGLFPIVLVLLYWSLVRQPDSSRPFQ